MVACEPDKRPKLGEILKSDDWLKEVINLTKDEEKKIIKELEEIHNDIKGLKEIEIEKKIKDEKLNTRAEESNQDEIFEDKLLKPKKFLKTN